ncbi:MAG: beta-lactamase family protein [Desulfobacterales bacterium]|nr:beta-lactamase family protein [Desulfobacterales bacterium]
MEKTDVLMQRAIEDGVFPGAVLLVAKKDEIIFHKAYGQTNISNGEKVTVDTLFDLASLTKPLATTPAIMILVQKKKLFLGQQLASIIPEFKGTDKAPITIRNLLCHRSGLPAWLPYYKRLVLIEPEKRKHALHELLVNEPLVNAVGQRTLYSDLGFIILNWVIETITGTSLDCFVGKHIYKPLGLENLFFLSPGEKQSEKVFAATEDCPWRGNVLSGAVHDDNTYVLGGVEGHAGLFGTAGSIHKVLVELLAAYQHGRDTFFPTVYTRQFFSRQDKTDWALGFDTPSSTDSSSGTLFSRNSVGHLGFTGTSFWMDLDRSIIIILLSNRIHPSRDNLKIKEFRPILHNEAMKMAFQIGVPASDI